MHLPVIAALVYGYTSHIVQISHFTSLILSFQNSEFLIFLEHITLSW